MKPELSGEKWGFRFRNFWVIPPIFDDCFYFSEGLAAVKVGSFWGFIGYDAIYVNDLRELRFVIQPIFEDVFYGFVNGLCPVMYDGRWGMIDKKGEFVIKPVFDGLKFYQRDFIPAQLNGRWGYINLKGEFVIEPNYFDCGYFSEGLAKVLLEKWGYINRKGEVIIPNQFDDCQDFSLKLAAYKLGSRWGYVNDKGDILIKPIFEYASKFQFIKGFKVAVVRTEAGVLRLVLKGKRFYLIGKDKRLIPVE